MSRRSLSEAEKEYRASHWGLSGEANTRKLVAPDPRHGVATLLGELVAVTYCTMKLGDSEPTNYEHDFGTRGKGLPWLAYNDTGLLILGGAYAVTYRGIVG